MLPSQSTEGKAVKLPTVVRLTDKHLADVYKGLLTHYKKCTEEDRTNPEKLRDTLGSALCREFHQGGSLHQLTDEDREQVFTLFYTFLDATASTANRERRNTFQSNQDWYYNQFKNQPITFSMYSPRSDYYSNRRERLFHDLLLWNLLLSMPRTNYRRSSASNDLRALLVICALVGVAVLFYFAVSCVFNALLDSAERLWYNEGIIQAFLSLMSVLVSASAASACATIMILAFNPVGLALLGVAGTSMAAAWLSSVVANLVVGYGTALINANALNPKDPHRFTLTASDIRHLKKAHPELDPVKIKCAIAALSDSIGNMPSASARFFGSGKSAQEKLKCVRQLRRGELQEVKVGELTFNLLKYQQQVAQNSWVEVGVPSTGADGGPVDGTIVPKTT